MVDMRKRGLRIAVIVVSSCLVLMGVPCRPPVHAAGLAALPSSMGAARLPGTGPGCAHASTRPPMAVSGPSSMLKLRRPVRFMMGVHAAPSPRGSASRKDGPVRRAVRTVLGPYVRYGAQGAAWRFGRRFGDTELQRTRSATRFSQGVTVAGNGWRLLRAVGTAVRNEIVR